MTAQAYMPEARIYVGNLNFQLTKEDVRRIFESLGQIVKVEMPAEPGEPSRSRGFAFVHFSDPRCVQQALAMFNGVEVAGRKMKVGLPSQR